MKSRFARVALALVTASAAAVGIAGPASAVTYDGLTYSFPFAGTGEGSEITGNAAAAVSGTTVDVVVFASGITEADEVVMHFHDGTSCDADGGIALAVATDPVEVIGADGEFVLETTVDLGTTDFENVYFNLHNAAGGAVIACGTLDQGPDPQIAAPAQVTYSAVSLPLNGADITASGSVTLFGNRLTVNLAFEGADLRDGSRHILMLRDSAVCEPGTFENLTQGLVRSVTAEGSTEPPSVDYTLLDVWNNSPWQPVAGTPDTLTVDIELILSDEEAAALSGSAFILHGSESETNTSRPPDRGGLTVQETVPSQCVSLTEDTNTPVTGSYFNLDFVEQNESGISGSGWLANPENSAVAESLQVLMDLQAPSPTDGSNYKVLLATPESLQCSGDLAEQTWPAGDNRELDLLSNVDPKTGLDANLGRIRNFEALVNETGFTGERAELLNASEFTVLVTDNEKAQILACATLVPALGEAPPTPEPPVVEPNTVAEATTLDEIVNATDYRPVEDAEILRLYQAFFNREPDVEGAKYWLQVSRNGRRTIDIAGDFTIASAEFQNTYADAPDNREFLVRVYDNMLGREPDEAGLNYWLDRVNGDNANGTNPNLGQLSRGRAVFYVALNQEFINNYPFAPVA